MVIRSTTTAFASALLLSCGAKSELLVAPIDAGTTVDGHMPIAGCDYAPLTGDAFGTTRTFASAASLPAGRYRIRFVDGCMKYSPAQGWTVNAYPAGGGEDQWWLVAGSSARSIAVLPGNVGFEIGAGAFADFEACVNASRAAPPLEIDFAGGTLGVRLVDAPYDDNVAGLDGRSPTWAIECVGR